MLDRRLDEGIGYALDARQMAGQAGDPRPTATRRPRSARASSSPGGWTRAGRWSRRRSRRAGREHLEAEAARGYRMIGSCASVLVEYERAEHWLREGIDYAERVELWNHRHYMAAHLAHVLWATGDWAPAAGGRPARARRWPRRDHDRITALHVLGYVALGRGDWPAADRVLDEARRARRADGRAAAAVAGAVGSRRDGPAARRRRRGGGARARRGLAASAAVDDAAYLYPFLVTGCRAYLALGDPLAADGGSRRSGRASRIGRSRARCRRSTTRGASCCSPRARPAGRAALEAALAGWRSRDRRWEGTWAQIDLARCLLRSNQRLEAGRLAAAARDDAARLGSPPLVAAAEEVLALAGRRGTPRSRGRRSRPASSRSPGSSQRA